MNRTLFFALFLLVLIGLDWYVWQAVRTVWPHRRLAAWLYWGVAGLVGLAMLTLLVFADGRMPRDLRSWLVTAVFANYVSKLFASLFLVVDDLGRAVRWAVLRFGTSEAVTDVGRADFLAKTSVAAGLIPFAGMVYGISSGAYDYRIRRVTVRLPNLPAAFDGLRIAQLSDIHSGSFFNKTAVKGGVEMLLRERPDVVFFTGDLVNNQASEMKEYQPIFEKVKAPLGVYSTFGNHDYGDYVNWPSAAAKRQNLADLAKVHEQMGWNLLRDENRALRVDGEEIAVLGVENWGKGRFPKYGDLAKAYQGTEEQPVKLLLSHDPSHWRGQVLPGYPDIDLMFAGHTHGMQFGIEFGPIKWSPVKYVYPEWAGLYQEGQQRLYVNRGYGFLGFPGRVGILPEITVMTLRRG